MTVSRASTPEWIMQGIHAGLHIEAQAAVESLRAEYVAKLEKIMRESAAKVVLSMHDNFQFDRLGPDIRITIKHARAE